MDSHITVTDRFSRLLGECLNLVLVHGLGESPWDDFMQAFGRAASVVIQKGWWLV